jgi:acetyl esterase
MAPAVPPHLHPELAALLPRLTEACTPPAREVGLAQARARFGALLRAGLAGGPSVPAEDVILAAGLPGRVYRPADARGGTVVLLHGGGWTVGSVADYDGLARRIAAALAAVVLSVEYRRAPEHPFPAAVDDAVAATRWAIEHAAALGGDATRVAVAGDSGGGNLAAVVCQQLRDTGGPLPAAQLLLYPSVSRGADHPSARDFGHLPFLTRSDMGWYTRNYVPRGTDLGDPRISPAEGELAGLPPALVVTAGVDPLHDSGRDYAAALRAAGGRVEELDLPDMPHGFAHLVALSPAADAALGQVLARAGALLAAPQVEYTWRGRFDNGDVNALHAEGFGHRVLDEDWVAQVERYSLGWVTAVEDGQLVGFVNVAWDGGVHAFLLDTLVRGDRRRRGIGRRLVAVAVDAARGTGCEWLHVDFEEHLRGFYLDECGFTPTGAGLIALS